MTIHKIKFDFLCGDPSNYEALFDCIIDITLPEGESKISIDFLLSQIACKYSIDTRANPMFIVDGRAWISDPDIKFDVVIPDRAKMIDVFLFKNILSKLSVQIYKLPEFLSSHKVRFFAPHFSTYKGEGTLEAKPLDVENRLNTASLSLR